MEIGGSRGRIAGASVSSSLTDTSIAVSMVVIVTVR